MLATSTSTPDRRAACADSESLAAVLDRITGSELEPAAASNGAAYTRRVFHRNENHEVAAASWLPGRASSLHGHSDSDALLRVRRGVLVEERYLPDGDGRYRYEASILRCGDESHLPAGAFHRLHCVEAADTVSVFRPPPAESVVQVPEDLKTIFAEAKQPAVQAITTDGHAEGTLLAIVRCHLDQWAQREEEQTRAGHTYPAASTIAEFRTSGLLAAAVPIEFEGMGASLQEVAKAVRLVAQRAPATALSLAMPLGNAATTRIPRSVVPQQCRCALAAGQRWIAAQALAGKLLAVANSEPGAGGDLAQTRTIARLDSDNTYRLTGSKSFATLGADADYYLCAAKTESGTVDGFFVSRTAPGVALADDWDPLGMRTTGTRWECERHPA